MDEAIRTAAISPLRQRLIDNLNVRRFSRATLLGRSPDRATAEDVRRVQIEQREAGVPTPTMNMIVSTLWFFFTQTIDRPDLARKLIRTPHPRNLPVVLSREEAARLLNATTCLKHQAALSVAYGSGFSQHLGAQNRHTAHQCGNETARQTCRCVGQTTPDATVRFGAVECDKRQLSTWVRFSGGGHAFARDLRLRAR